MFQEIIAYTLLGIAIYSLIGNFFFKSKKKGTKHCGVNDCDIH